MCISSISCYTGYDTDRDRHTHIHIHTYTYTYTHIHTSSVSYTGDDTNIDMDTGYVAKEALPISKDNVDNLTRKLLSTWKTYK